MQPIISIIIPIYNVEQYLEQCLNSVLVDNCIDNMEVICVNDGSTDNSLGICNLYTEKYKNLKVISQPNAGLSAARNTGLKNATGEYVCFLDSDDFLLPNTLKQIEELIRNRYSVDVICCNTVANGIEPAFPINLKFFHGSGVDFCEYFYSKMHFAYPTEAWHYICRKEFLLHNKILFKHGYLHEDEDFTPRILLYAKEVALFSMPIIFYRVKRAGSISSNIKRKNFNDILQIVNDLYYLFIENNAPKIFYEMQFVLLLTTLYRMNNYKIKLPAEAMDLLYRLAIDIPQKRTVKLAKFNMNLAYRYFRGEIPYIFRKFVNILFY